MRHQGAAMSRATPPKLRPTDIVDAQFAAAATLVGDLPPPTGWEIAFAGRSNVGKSSLLNSLMRRKNLVRTSSTPGCTRQIAFFEARDRSDARYTLVDLPGYGYAKRSKTERRAWATLIESYLLTRPTLCLVCILIDSRRSVEAEEQQLMELLKTPCEGRATPKVLLVATKLDRVPASKQKNVLHKLNQSSGQPVIGHAVGDDRARDRLWSAVRSALGQAAIVEPGRYGT